MFGTLCILALALRCKGRLCGSSRTFVEHNGAPSTPSWLFNHNIMSIPLTPKRKFIEWYVRPFNRLKRIRTGDGAFVILSMGLSLWERYYRIKSNSIKAPRLTDKFHMKAARDF